MADDEAVYKLLDDLAEGQRHDCQIVAVQAQHRDADKSSRDAREDRAHHYREREAHSVGGDGILQAHRGDDAGERADAHEARVSQTQLAEDADGEVQGDGHDDVAADWDELTLHRAGEQPFVHQRVHDDKGDDDADISREVRDLCLVKSLFHLGTSDFLRHILAEQTGRTHQQRHDKHRKDDGVCKLRGDIRLCQRLDYAEQQTAEERAGDRADAAEHRRGEGFDAGHGAGRRHKGGVGRAEQHARDRRESRADSEGKGNGAVDVDAHELGRRLILGHGAHSLAHLGLAGEEGQRRHDDKAHHDRQKRDVGDRKLAVEEPERALDHRAVRLGVRAPDEQGGVLEEVAHADSGDKHRERRSRAQRLIRQTLDDNAEHRTHDHCDEYRRPCGQSPRADRHQRHIAADHYNVAMGEVQHLGDAVNHGIAQRDYRVHAAETDTADEI